MRLFMGTHTPSGRSVEAEPLFDDDVDGGGGAGAGGRMHGRTVIEVHSAYG